MAYQQRMSYGPVEIYIEKTLGIGSYGKVCRAKCGQLPCAAKLLHDTFFQYNDPSAHHLAENFEQESQLLSVIKHPNIVQYLKKTQDPESGRVILLMELMDESLTKFLERSDGPLPYQCQIDICHDVALALSFLHNNKIVHRDLSSNNILLIAGKRAKITDFGMSKLIDICMNPKLTPLTQVPGTQVYMPPEALTTPSRYSEKLDCFSYGVLIIQIATRNFPEPGEGTKFVEDPKYPTGRVIIVIPELERRKKDINQVNRHHPLLPTALLCLKDRENERPTAEQVCECLSTIKKTSEYKESERIAKDHFLSIQMLNQQLETSKKEYRALEENLERMRLQNNKLSAEKDYILAESEQECKRRVEAKEQSVVSYYRSREESLLQQLNMKEGELTAIEKELNTVRPSLQRRLYLTERENQTLKERIKEYEELLSDFQRRDLEKSAQQRQTKEKKQRQHASSPKLPPTQPLPLKLPYQFQWRRGRDALDQITGYTGQVTVLGDTAYFTQDYRAYSYTENTDKWEPLPRCPHKNYGVAIINHKLTAIGGLDGTNSNTNILLILNNSLRGKIWEELPYPMRTNRVHPACITTPTHLVVAGGWYVSPEGTPHKHSSIELMTLDTFTWLQAANLPSPVQYPQLINNAGFLLLSDTASSQTYSCSMERLIRSIQDNGGNQEAVWTRQANIPVKEGASIVSLRGKILAIGGCNDGEKTVKPVEKIYCYDKDENSWKILKTLPTPRYWTLSVVFPRDVLVVVGGYVGENWTSCNLTEKITLDF